MTEQMLGLSEHRFSVIFSFRAAITDLGLVNFDMFNNMNT
jgi:hypothetical protein